MFKAISGRTVFHAEQTVGRHLEVYCKEPVAYMGTQSREGMEERHQGKLCG